VSVCGWVWRPRLGHSQQPGGGARQSSAQRNSAQESRQALQLAWKPVTVTPLLLLWKAFRKMQGLQVKVEQAAGWGAGAGAGELCRQGRGCWLV